METITNTIKQYLLTEAEYNDIQKQIKYLNVDVSGFRCIIRDLTKERDSAREQLSSKPFLHEILSDEKKQIDCLTSVNADLRKANVSFAKKFNQMDNDYRKAIDLIDSLTIERNQLADKNRELNNLKYRSDTVNLGTYDLETSGKIQDELNRVRKADRTQGTRKIDRVRRKGRGSRKVHGNASYIALEHAEAVAVYIDLKA